MLLVLATAVLGSDDTEKQVTVIHCGQTIIKGTSVGVDGNGPLVRHPDFVAVSG